MHTTSYTILQDGGHYDNLDDLNTAIGLAEELLGGLSEGEKSTFTVVNEDGYLLASATNRLIIGTFYKQQWGGRKGNDAIPCGEEQFDATATILLMDHGDVVELENNSEQSDQVGQRHVRWDGPCSVHITESICEFFGVSDVEEITKEALAYARSRCDLKSAELAREVAKLDVQPIRSLVMNAPEFFRDAEFMAWLNNGLPKFTWHIKGNAVADEYSDVVVCVDPSLSGEGSDSDMPEYIWNKIVEACRQHIGPRSGEDHYLVRITNLEV